jgi:hypothetical protein
VVSVTVRGLLLLHNRATSPSPQRFLAVIARFHNRGPKYSHLSKERNLMCKNPRLLVLCTFEGSGRRGLGRSYATGCTCCGLKIQLCDISTYTIKKSSAEPLYPFQCNSRSSLTTPKKVTASSSEPYKLTSQI